MAIKDDKNEAKVYASADAVLQYAQSLQNSGYAPKNFSGDSEGLGITDQMELTSFEGFSVIKWDESKPKPNRKNKGSYFAIVVNNGKKLPISAFTKKKFWLTPSGDATDWTATGHFADFAREHSNPLDLGDLQAIEGWLKDAVVKKAKFSKEPHATTKDGFTFEINKYNIVK